jgi:hypothetical protein
MLVADEKRLRWLWMDMRPRWRRRVMVVWSYGVFLVAVWAHPQWVNYVPVLMYVMSLLQSVDRLMKESIGTEGRRVALGAVLLTVMWFLWEHPPTPHQIAADIFAFLWISGWSALSYGKLVDAVWLRSSVRRRFGRPRHLESLDEFATHYYGESFEALTEEQQLKVGRLHRANPMGEWVKAGSGRFPTGEDERLRHEDDRLRAQVQRLMTWLLIGSATVWSIMNGGSHRSVSGEIVAAWVWTVAALAMTLRQAIVLWSEEYPSGTGEQMELVEREA